MSRESAFGSTTPSSRWPSCSARSCVFAFPPSSETTRRPSFPTVVGIDVLVAPLDLGDRRAVDAALVGERGPADVRLVVVRRDVGDLGDGAREVGQVRDVAPAGGQEREAGS